MRVRELFEKFKQLVDQAQDKKVAGLRSSPCWVPTEATRTRVMQELILKSYDVLHYAGHCMYDQQKPSASAGSSPVASVSVRMS